MNKYPKFINDFIRMCSDGYQQGWHERNGGNLTYRLTDEDIQDAKYLLEVHDTSYPIGTHVPHLANAYFLVTGSGKFFRNVALDPEASIGIIQIDATGERYYKCWGLINHSVPTSELPSHLMNHEVKMLATNGSHRVIYHAHPANLIALTFVFALDDKVFTKELWGAATECPVVFPSGVGVVDWMVPGGKDIAVASSEKMKEYDAIVWAHHGLFCSGESLDITFGLMHTIEKAAEIIVKALSMNLPRINQISDEELRQLAKDFQVTLPDKFLS